MVLKLRLDTQAWDDFSAIRSHLVAELGAAVAGRISNNLRRRMHALRNNPGLGIRTNDADICILPPKRYPYRIYYTATPEAVVILHIRHINRGGIE